MSDLLETYLSALPALWLADTARYLVAAALMSVLLAAFWRAGLAARKLQARHASARDISREVLASLRSSLVFSLVAAAIFVAAQQGWLTIYWGFGRAGPL